MHPILDFLKLEFDDVFLEQIEWGLYIADTQSANKTHRKRLIKSEMFWQWVLSVWKSKDDYLASHIIEKNGGFHVLPGESKTKYVFFKQQRAWAFYLDFHKPRYEDLIPLNIFTETNKDRNAPHSPYQREGTLKNTGARR